MNCSEYIKTKDEMYIPGVYEFWQKQPVDATYNFELKEVELLTDEFYTGKQMPDDPFIQLLAIWSEINETYRKSGQVEQAHEANNMLHEWTGDEINPKATYIKIKKCDGCGANRSKLTPVSSKEFGLRSLCVGCIEEQ